MSQLDEVRQMVREANAIFDRVECDQRRDAMLIRLGMAIGDERGYCRGEADEASLWTWALGLARKAALQVPRAELIRRRSA